MATKTKVAVFEGSAASITKDAQRFIAKWEFDGYIFDGMSEPVFVPSGLAVTVQMERHTMESS